MFIYREMDGPSSGLKDDDVKELFKLANISPTQFEYLLPKKSQLANHPPEGYISVYKHQIEKGLRFPLHHLVIDICNCLNVSPSQLKSIATSTIVGFILCARLYNLPVTVDCFFSLFNVSLVDYPQQSKESFFVFLPKGKNFLERDLTHDGANWLSRFFFLRPVGKSWNCVTKWNDKYCCPRFDASSRALALKSGIRECGFRVSELIKKDVLVHGGIEPGVPSPRFTFRLLMHKAAVTKFKLCPQDIPPANVTIKVSNKSPLCAAGDGMINTLANFVAAPSPSEVHTHKVLSSTSENTVPHKELFHEGEDNCSAESPAAHKKINSAVLVLDEAQPQPSSAPLLAISKTLELMFVPKEMYEKLEKVNEKLEKVKEEVTSELTLAKSRVQELEQEIELYRAKRVYSDFRTSQAMIKVNILEKTMESVKSDSDCLHDKIKKDVIEEFKSSHDFVNAVHEEAVKYYVNGFETCKSQVLNSGKLPSKYNLDFLDVADAEWGRSSRSMDNAADADLNKSLKRKKT